MSKFARMMLSALALLACTAYAQNTPSYRAVKFDAQFRPHILNDVGQVAGMGQDGRPAIWNPDGSIQGTGGSTAIPQFRDPIRALFPEARVVEGDAFGSVGLGLALDAQRKFG